MPPPVLTDSRIRAARPHEKPYKLLDREGLYLRITPEDHRSWRLRIYLNGRESMMSLGPYPEISLREARERAMDARRQIAQGIDPIATRRAAQDEHDHTFGAIAAEWMEKQRKRSERTQSKNRWILLKLCRPIAKTPVGALTASQVLSVLARLEDQDLHETAHRTRQKISQVLRYAVATQRATHDVTADLRGALAPIPVEHRAALTDPAAVGALLRAIDGYVGQPSACYALKIAPYVFLRPGELRGAEWGEIDLAGALWRIPGPRMKMELPHLVPLSRQAVGMFREVQRITGRGKLCFPGLRSAGRPISNNTLNAALRRIGYSGDEQTSHGFRTIASTLLNELGFRGDWIEAQLAHVEPSKVRAAYNAASYLEWRRPMMQVWADYLDALKGGDATAARAAALSSIQPSISLSSHPTAPPRLPG